MRDLAWGESKGNLRYGISCTSTLVRFVLQNVGLEKIKVMSHVAAAGENHLDWTVLNLVRYSGENIELRFVDERKRSAAIHCDLEPDAVLQHSVNILDWINRAANKAMQVRPGKYTISADYTVAGQSDCWAGSIHSGMCSLSL